MKILRQFAFTAFALMFVASSAVMSFAGDPPSRVARLKYISGEVSMQPGGVDDWAAATINRPMTTADRLWSDKNSRVELHLGSAAMRMDSETSLTLTNLSDSTVQLELDEGTLNVQVARLSRGEIFEVDTPNTAFTILKNGTYRFDVDSNGDTTLVTVWKGKGVATGQGQAVGVDSRHQARFTGGMSLQHATYKAPRLDGFDEWCQVRAERESHAVSVRYVSPDVVGYEDLGEYGSWRQVPEYGAVWAPTRVEAGWAPYRYGSWTWVEPWGWTWVDDAPWGFAPFHYGRWVSISGSWGWVPGPVNVRPCYAPALVAWIGSSGAGIGWFPLGYGEPYVPYYHVSRNYFQTINVSNTRITNITYVTNSYYNVNNVHITNIHYVNQTGGMTVVNNEVLVNSRRVGRDVFIDHDKDWREHHDGWVTAGPPVAPSRHSVLGVHADRSAPAPPERIWNRRVVVHNAPPERPLPFESKRADLENHHGRPLDNSEEDRLRKRMPDNRPDHSSSGNGNAQAASDRGHDAGRPDNRRSDDRDHGNSVAGDRRDNPSRVARPSRQGDDDHTQATASGNNGNPRDREQNPGMNNGQQHSEDAQNSQHGNSNWDRQQQNDTSSRWRVPRPPRPGDNAPAQSTSAGGNNPAPRQLEQNPGMKEGQQRADDPQNSQHGNASWNRQQPNDPSAGRRVPRPPSRGDDAPAQPTSAGGNSPAPRQLEQNPGASNGQQQRADDGRNSQNNNSRWNRQPDNASAGRQVARPPVMGGDQSAPAQQAQGWQRPDAGQANSSPGGVQQADPMRDRHGPPAQERQSQQPSYGNRNAGSPPVTQTVRDVPRPAVQQAQPVETRRDNPAPERQMRPSYNDRSSAPPAAQQANRSTPPPPQPVPAPRVVETQHSAPAVPAPHTAASKDSGSGGNHGANQFQDRGKSQDH